MTDDDDRGGAEPDETLVPVRAVRKLALRVNGTRLPRAPGEAVVGPRTAPMLAAGLRLRAARRGGLRVHGSRPAVDAGLVGHDDDEAAS
jgi:hypothetical protein